MRAQKRLVEVVDQLVNLIWCSHCTFTRNDSCNYKFYKWSATRMNLVNIC
jgi:hypothetical protein